MVFILQLGRRSKIKKIKNLFVASFTIIAEVILIKCYKNSAKKNYNTTNDLNFGNNIYDLNKKELAAIKNSAKLLDIKEKDNNEF